MPAGLGFGLGLNLQRSAGSGADLEPPEGFAFVVTNSGEYVVDGDGAYAIAETE